METTYFGIFLLISYLFHSKLLLFLLLLSSNIGKVAELWTLHYAKQAFKHCIYTIVRKDHGRSRCPRSQLSGVTSCSSQRRRKMIYLPDTQNCVTSAQLQLLLLSTHIHSNRVENRRTWVRTKLKQALVDVYTATEM